MNWLAIDIGGAYLKFADGMGYAESYPFALWRKPQHLAHELRTLIAEAPPADHLAITMTGELADCFETKATGVQFILDAVQQAADARHTRVYLSDGRMVAPQIARMNPRLAAASNWHALAKFAGRYARQGPGLLIDIGSTTCDIIPLVNGVPQISGVTDTERLLAWHLVYTGVERSPVCAVVDSVPYRGTRCPVAQEFFATVGDAYILLDEMPEDSARTNTADGRPATKIWARRRLGRVICADDENFSQQDALEVSKTIAQAQVEQIQAATQRVIDGLPGRPYAIVVSGQGEFLARDVIASLKLSATIVSLDEKLGAVVSRCAPAHALAVVAREAVEG